MVKKTNLNFSLVVALVLFAVTNHSHAQNSFADFGKALKGLADALQEGTPVENTSADANTSGNASLSPQDGEESNSLGGGSTYILRSPTGNENIGTVASSEEICEVLGHPLFKLDLTVYQGNTPTKNGYWVWEDNVLAVQWLLDRLNKLRFDSQWGWLPDDKTAAVIEASLSSCLKKLSASNPNSYRMVSKHFLTYLSQYKEPCFNKDEEFKTEKRIRDDGSIVEIRVKKPTSLDPPLSFDPQSRRCFSPGYYGNQINMTNGLTFMALLTLKEAHLPLKTSLDGGYKEHSVKFAKLNSLRASEAQEKQKEAGKALVSVFSQWAFEKETLPAHKEKCTFLKRWGSPGYSQRYIDHVSKTLPSYQQKLSQCHQAIYGNPITEADYRNWLSTDKTGAFYGMTLNVWKQSGTKLEAPRTNKDVNWCVDAESESFQAFMLINNSLGIDSNKGWCEKLKAEVQAN